jgi:hypothetical protein
MAWRFAKWQAATLCAAVIGLGAAQSDHSGFTDLSDHQTSILEGNWQSCRGADGQYGERIFDSSAPGLGKFELHLGPYHDFALFRGVQEAHREHDSAGDLLKPHTVEVDGNLGRHVWDVAGLHFEAALAGGSQEDCESWWITLRRSDSTSSEISSVR